MKIYLHCTSTANQLDQFDSKSDEEIRVVRILRGCLTEGAVVSKCGRKVIEIGKFLTNVKIAINNLETNLEYERFQSILTACLGGIADSDHYTPKEIPSPHPNLVYRDNNWRLNGICVCDSWIGIWSDEEVSILGAANDLFRLDRGTFQLKKTA